MIEYYCDRGRRKLVKITCLYYTTGKINKFYFREFIVKPKLIILGLLINILLTGCLFNSNTTVASSSFASSSLITDSSVVATQTTSSAKTTSSAESTTGIISTTPGATVPPTTGILSDPTEFQPGNPVSHALVNRKPSTKVPADKTRPQNNHYRPIFNDYLAAHYPEQSFRVVSIEDYQRHGLTYKRGTAYSLDSADIIFELIYDGRTLTDSFQEDVVTRQTTMNRWRFEFQKLLDPITRDIADDETVKADVSYDYYPENRERIKLDQELEPKSSTYRRCLELYFNMGYTDSDNVASTASQIYAAIELNGYSFQEYFIYLESAKGVKTAYQIPASLIGDPALADHLKTALSHRNSSSLIKRVERLRP